MEFIRKRIVVWFWLVIFGAAFSFQSGFAEEPAQTSPSEIKSPVRYLVVTYFHTNFRCPTCQKLEELSADAVKMHFGDAVNSGKLVWRVINVEEAGNEHFVKDYQLYSKHLIVSEMKDGREVRWKDLKDIWTLVRNEGKFDQYVKTEISQWLAE